MRGSLQLALYLATVARGTRRRDPAAIAEDAKREQLGFATLDRPQGQPLVWFHVGGDPEADATRNLAARMRGEREDLAFVMTTTGRVESRRDVGMLVQSCPNEDIPAIRRFLGHWQPEIAVFTDADLRPALITQTETAGIPMFLVGVDPPRITRRQRRLTTTLLRKFRRILARNASAANGFLNAGAHPLSVEISGALTEGTPALPCDEDEREQLTKAFGARPVWVAAQVTAEECHLTVTAHMAALRKSHRLLLILVPEHGADGLAIATALDSSGQKITLRSRDGAPEPDTQIYVADIPGELGLWYRFATIAYLGQSLVEGGGINPFEAAALGSAILHGPGIDHHLSAYARLAQAGAARTVRDAEELGAAVEALLSPDTAAQMAHAAWDVSTEGAGVTDRVTDMILTEIESV